VESYVPDVAVGVAEGAAAGFAVGVAVCVSVRLCGNDLSMWGACDSLPIFRWGWESLGKKLCALEIDMILLFFHRRALEIDSWNYSD